MGAQYCFLFQKKITSSSGQTYCFPTWIRYEYDILKARNVVCVQGWPVYSSCLYVTLYSGPYIRADLREVSCVVISSRASCSGRFGCVLALRPMPLVFVVFSGQILRNCNWQVISIQSYNCVTLAFETELKLDLMFFWKVKNEGSVAVSPDGLWWCVRGYQRFGRTCRVYLLPQI